VVWTGSHPWRVLGAHTNNQPGAPAEMAQPGLGAHYGTGPNLRLDVELAVGARACTQAPCATQQHTRATTHQPTPHTNPKLPRTLKPVEPWTYLKIPVIDRQHTPTLASGSW